MNSLSLIAEYDDLRRCEMVLMDGAAEEEFLNFLTCHRDFNKLLGGAIEEAQRLQKELDSSLHTIATLESKLFHARRLLEMETKSKMEAQVERETMERKMIAVNDILRNEVDIKDETRNKIAFLNCQPRKRKSALEKKLDEQYGNDINSTGSFLSDLSVTQSEDDLLNVTASRKWKKFRPSNNPELSGVFVGGKRSRISTEKRKSGNINKNKHIEIDDTDKIVAHTKVSIPQGDGPIVAESIIEAIPQRDNDNYKTPQTKKSSIKNTPYSHHQPSAPPAEVASSMPKHMFKRSMIRPHQFSSKTFLKSDTCLNCQKRIKFGAVGLKCKECRVCIHVDCREFFSMACVPQSAGTPVKGAMGTISDYAPSVGPMVPALIVHCVNEIETRGLNEEGLYRVSGIERDVKSLKEQFLRGKGIPFLGNSDVHVLCGCLKIFLRSLKEPLIPTDLWKDFTNAIQNANTDKSTSDLKNAINKLPHANRDTLAFLMQHFQRVAESIAVQMPIKNIAKIFGPTIVGYSSADPDQQTLYTETFIQFKVMEGLLNIPNDYWAKFLSVDFNEEQLKTKTVERQNFFDTPMRNASEKKRKIYATPPYPTLRHNIG